MNPISEFFGKFKKLLSVGIAERQTVSDALFRVLGIHIDPKLITVKEGVAHIPTNPVLRSECVLKKQQILEEMRKINPESRISDIR